MGRRKAWLGLVGATILGLASASEATAQGRLMAWTEGRDELTMPLTEESLSVHIDGQYATAELRQTYQNETPETVEGQYVLNVGTGARALGFAYYNGEDRIVGEVFEREAAARIYEEVTGIGRDPGLLEETGEGTFSFRVFPIAAGEPKRVEVRWGQRLARDGDRVRYRVPLAAERSSVRVRITDDRPIASVTSATHRLTVSRRGPGAVEVTVGEPLGATRELVLDYVVDAPDWALQAVVHRDAGHDPYLSLSLAVPEGLSEGAVSAKDVTLVLDRSGSMTGAPMEQARLSAMEIVARLPATDRVNVIAFDDQVESLYPTPRPVTDAVREEARGYVERIEVRGGTDIASALEAALRAQARDDRPHVVLFLTDGQSDAQAALAVAAADAGDARVYTIGVGAGVARPLLSRLARGKRGTFTFVESTDAIVERMNALYDQIAAPVLVGVELEVEGGRLYDRYPRTLPDVHRHQELQIGSRVFGAGPLTVRLKGTVAGRPFRAETRVTLPEEASRPWVGRLWAASKVDDLLEDIALLGETDERKDTVTELALAYSFATPYTSFLAIPESELTDTARTSLEQLREQRRQLMQRHRDAAALSRSAMPPGDPILRVHAPVDAVQVTAYFPFGLVKDLRYDPETELWQCRFLVPVDVEDDAYRVQIVVVPASGEPYVADVPYVIDSAEPDFEVEVEVDEATGMATVRVMVAEEARRVTVALVADPRRRVVLAPDENGVYAGAIELPELANELRVVVADLARNEGEEIVDANFASAGED